MKGKWVLLVLSIVLLAPTAYAYDDFVWPNFTAIRRLLPRSRVIYAGGYLWIDFEVDVHTKHDPGVAGWFNVSDTTGVNPDDIVFYVCDEYNYERFSKGEEFIVVYQSEGRVSHESFNVSIPESGTYGVLFSNSYSSTDKVVWGDVRFLWIPEPFWAILGLILLPALLRRRR